MSLWTPPPDDAPQRLAELRVNYQAGTLDEADCPADPLTGFQAWFAAAVDSGMPEPNAMVLSTADPSGQPSSRTVLLKQADDRGFAFYTNLESRKSRELSENPRASCVFPWIALQRQVCVVGRVRLIERSEVAEYFASRPRGSRLGAWASAQSSVIPGRARLERRYADLESQFPDDDIPVPDFWGGWLIVPETVEFWQGRASRLHDRLRYRRLDGGALMSDPSGWVLERLSP